MKSFKLILLALMAAAIVDAQTVYCVKIDGNDTQAGTSWGTAFATLQKALSVATSGNQIWVAAGTYKPTTTSDRTVAFQLKTGVAIYGGFAGTEVALGSRDWNANVTILSGDIDGDLTSTGNSYHVLTGNSVNSTAMLDGFTITLGNADGVGSGNDLGGGMYLLLSSPTLSNLTISNNKANTNGGGICNLIGSPVLANVIFSGNQSANTGGGMHNELNSNPTLTNVSFISNTAVNGAGMYNVSTSNTDFTNIIFRSNTASSKGGGLYVDGSIPVLKNVLFQGNSATSMGGGIYNQAANSVFTNITLYNNSSHFGGGMFITGSSASPFTNTIIWANSASSQGAQIYNSSSGSVTFSYSIIDGGIAGTGIGGSPLTDGGNDSSSDPLFANPGGNDFSLTQASPAVDAGNNSVVTATTDLSGNSRISGGTVDIGAYEYQAPLPVELISFLATTRGVNAELRWTTATETNNYGFEVERNTVSSEQSTMNPWKSTGFVEGSGSSNASKEYTFIDKNLAAGRYVYRLKQIDRDGQSKYSQEIHVEVGSIPSTFELMQNFPNPFNPATALHFSVPATGKATLKIYNVLGQEIATLFDGIATEGDDHQTIFSAQNLPSGIYVARLEYSGKHMMKKMMLVK